MSNPFTTIGRSSGVYRVATDAPPVSFPGQAGPLSCTVLAVPAVRPRVNADTVSSRLIPATEGLHATPVAPAAPSTCPVIVGNSQDSGADVGPGSVAPAKLASFNTDPEVQRLTESISNGTLILRQKLGTSAMNALCHILKDPECGLVTLSIQDSAMGIEGMRLLAEALKINRTVTDLDVSWNDLDAPGAALLAEALKANRVITQLHLPFNAIGVAGAASLSEMLKVNNTLTKLNLGKNAIGTAGAAALSEALETNGRLATLYLGLNQIGDDGIGALAKMLKTNKSLTQIYIGQNNVNPASAVLLSEALKANCTLTTFLIDSNSIGAAGAACISEALKSNRTLTRLGIAGNDIGSAGAASLSEMLKVNHVLAKLHVGRNQIGLAGALRLSDALKHNVTLTMLDLGDENIDPECAASITSRLQRNQRHLLMQHAALSMELASDFQYPAEIYTLLIKQMAGLPAHLQPEGIATIKDLSAAIGYLSENM